MQALFCPVARAPRNLALGSKLGAFSQLYVNFKQKRSGSRPNPPGSSRRPNPPGSSRRPSPPGSSSRPSPHGSSRCTSPPGSSSRHLARETAQASNRRPSGSGSATTSSFQQRRREKSPADSFAHDRARQSLQSSVRRQTSRLLDRTGTGARTPVQVLPRRSGNYNRWYAEPDTREEKRNRGPSREPNAETESASSWFGCALCRQTFQEHHSARYHVEHDHEVRGARADGYLLLPQRLLVGRCNHCPLTILLAGEEEAKIKQELRRHRQEHHPDVSLAQLFWLECRLCPFQVESLATMDMDRMISHLKDHCSSAAEAAPEPWGDTSWRRRRPQNSSAALARGNVRESLPSSENLSNKEQNRAAYDIQRLEIERLMAEAMSSRVVDQ